MKQHPLVSIITPSLNQGIYIGQTIASVLSQDYPNIELIVMDGGSTDGTIDILKKFGSRIRWISKKDKGQADAINKGMQLAKGEICCYLNSDDYLLPGAIASVVENFSHHPEVGWVTGDYIIVNEKGEQIQQFIFLYKRLLRIFHIPLSFTNSIIQPSTFWRRRLMTQAGQFDSSLHYTFDYDYWFRLSAIQPPMVIGNKLSAFRIHKQSKGGIAYKQQFEEEELVLKRYTKNRIMVKLHQIHTGMITFIYDRIK